jgi:hypothetical protein
MEILDMTFAGIPVGLLIAVVAGWYFTRNAWREWRQDRNDIKEIEEAHKKFRAENEWKPRMVNGVDCGEWVSKKDGRIRADLVDTLGYEAWISAIGPAVGS